VLIDSRSGSNLLYLPLDKLMQQAGAVAAPAPAPAAAPASPPADPGGVDQRSREGARSRDRDTR
jgi:membrane protease subunit HflK